MPSSCGYKTTAMLLRMFFAPFTRCRVIGREHIPSRGACILAPNHISHFDPPLIGMHIRRPVEWMAMRELFEVPLLGRWLRVIGSFPVQMNTFDAGAVREAVTRLRATRFVGVFPEGGLRTGPESVLEGAPIRPGVAALAQMTSALVLPCVIIGSDALYSPKCWFPVFKTRIWIAFGTPLAPPTNRQDFDAQLGHVLRELYERTIREEHIPTACLPQTPQRRKGRA